MSEYTEPTSAEDVLQSSELAARLLRRLVVSPGVIDTQRLYKTYARLTEVITHAHPLLHELLARYFVANESTSQNLPLVMDQPWMLNLNTYLTNNSSVSSTSTTNNSFFTSTAINQSVLQSTTSLTTTNTNVFGATSEPAPPEKFRISRRPADRRQSVPADVQDDVLNPVPQRRIEPLTQSPAQVEVQPLTLAHHETRLSEPWRPVPSSVPTSTSPTLVQPPLAPPVIQREMLESEMKTTRLVLKDRERTKIERHSEKSEERQELNPPQTSRAITEIGAATATPPALPLVQEHISSPQTQTRPQQLIYRKSADTQTLRDLVADVSTSSSLAAVRQAIDSLPVTQTSPAAPTTMPESSFREAESRASEEITTEGMLRRISRMLLIERERRGY